MVTLVGMQNDFISALKNLLELEYEALETYVAAIDRIENEQYKEGLSQAKSDHERHIKELSTFFKNKGEKAPHGPSGMQVLSIGKVALASLIGDKAILQAMVQAENDTNTAYERMNEHKNKMAELDSILKQGLADERKNREWLKKTIEEK